MSIFNSAYKAVVTSFVRLFRRTGVYVGEGANYPRVEVHTVSESERLDKGDALRRLSATVESISAKSMTECNDLLQENLRLLAEGTLANVAPEGFAVVGIIPTQLQDLTESSDTQRIIYRLLQQVDVYVSRVGEPTPPPTPPTTGSGSGSGSGSGTNETTTEINS